MVNNPRIFFLLIFFTLISCGGEKHITIMPIDAELNENFLTGQHLDSAYFSTKNVRQYYHISDYQRFTPEKIQSYLEQEVQTKYKKNFSTIEELDIFFYKEKFWGDYNKHLYENARESENGTLEDENKNLVATIRYIRQKTEPKNFIRFLYIYADTPSYFKTDTLSLSQLSLTN